MVPSSKLFSPYRALGLVSTDIPLVVRYINRRKENLIVTVVGNSFHTFGEAKLALLSVGNPHEDVICCLTADSFHIYTACKNVIYAWRRGTELKHKYEGHQASVHLMVPFGPHLIAVDKNNVLCVWDIKVETLYLEMEFPVKSFEISAIVHPATYLNKILVGSKQGKIQLWNINSSKLIHTFNGWGSSVIILEQAPAQDVIAVGLLNGKIILHNIKYDETIVEFKQEWGRVTGIGFRTDNTPVMVTGSEMGHIAIWDLQERKLASQVYDAHIAPITGIQCLPSEPLMVTSSPDNTLKMWIFDMPDGGARLLKYREGHAASPLMLRFHGSLGDRIISAGEDSVMRISSTVNDILNRSLGKASYNRKAAKKKKVMFDSQKMPAITSFTSETSQEIAFDNIAATHRNKALVTTWSIHDQKMGKHKLVHERFKEREFSHANATCLEITVCGNFVIIGYSTGHIDKYNIQSGLFRGSFGKPTGHDSDVRGVITDGLNQFLISGGQEGELRWWRLKDCRGIKKILLDAGVAKMILHRDSGLMAACLEDWSIHIFDVDTKSVVRKLFGHNNQITDAAFSPDSKWLISCSLDKTIRTWDLPSGTCVDCFLVPAPPSSIAMSPIGDFLATTHAEHLGIYLWANLACYSHVSLRPLPNDFVASSIALPSTAADLTQMPLLEGEEQEEELEAMEEADEDYKSPTQISDELITLALLPTSKWLNLLSIDAIKKRNKPRDPPKVPKSAPFFIPTIPGLDFKFASPIEESQEKGSKLIGISSFEVLTLFGKALKSKDYESAMKMLLEMSPSSVEVEIRNLDPDLGGTEEVMVQFIYMLNFFLAKCLYFEAVQGYLSLFLKIHSDFFINNQDLKTICEQLVNVQGETWHNFQESINQTLCLVSYFKNAVLINY